MFKKRLLKVGMWFIGSLFGLALLLTASLYVFKDEICGYVISEVNQHLKAKVKVDKIDIAFWGSFPNLSVDFNTVFIQDSYKNSTEKDTLLYTDRIRFKFNPVDIWNKNYQVKQIEVSPGKIHLKINQKGENNYDILKPTKTNETTKFNLQLEKVVLDKIRFSYNNKASGQFYSSFLKTVDLEGAFSEKQYSLHSKSELILTQVKSENVTLISNKPAAFDLTILVNQAANLVEIPSAVVYVANLPFHLRGKVTDKEIHFRIHAKNLALTDVANHFTHASINQVKEFKGAGNVQFDVAIDGNVKSTEAPEINCSFGIQNGTLIEPSKNLKINKLFLTGRYSNKNGKENEFLRLSDISFITPGGPFRGDLLITHFEAPIFDGTANGNVDLNIAHQLFSFPEIDSIGGNCDVNSLFSVQVFFQSSENQYDIRKCEGDITLNNVAFKFKKDKRFFNRVKGSVYLRNDEVGMDEISLHVGSSDLKMEGVFHNIIGYLRNENSLTASLNVSSSFIDIQDLSTETKAEQISDGKNWILPEDINGDISLKAGEIKYEKHRFKQFQSQLLINKRLMHFSDLNVQNANAAIRGNLDIEEKSPEIFTITTRLESENIEFKSLFREWNNFEQEVISEDNISGRAHVALSFSAPFDLKNGVMKNAIKSQIQLKISEGRLKNVSTFKLITQSLKTSPAKLIFKKNNIADFEKKLLDLTFETFENTLIIRNGQLEIPSMVIKSNALDLELYGTHRFDDQIDYHFAFDLRDVRKTKKEDEFGEIIDDQQGLKVFLRMYGNLDNPTIVWDKTAKKEQAQENREAAKKDAKSILKTEFGLFKNDTAIKTYQHTKAPKEELKIEFGPTKNLEVSGENSEETKKKKKDSKIGTTLKKWKEESEKEKKEEFE